MRPRYLIGIAILCFVVISTIICITPAQVTIQTKTNPFSPQQINSSSANETTVDTEYNIHFRMVKYASTLQYAGNVHAINQFTDVIGIARMMNITTYRGKDYRVQGLTNGTLYVFNLTDVTSPSPQETMLVQGMNLGFVSKWNLDTSDFEPQKLCSNDVGPGFSALPRISIAGRNKTDNSLVIKVLGFNETDLTFYSVYNLSIPIPSCLTNLNGLGIYWAFYDSRESEYLISGKYLNGTTKIPFAYEIDDSSGSVILDMTNLTTSATDWQAFDDVILSMQPCYNNGGFWLLTNKHVMLTPYSFTKTILNYQIQEILYNSIYHSVGRVFSFSDYTVNFYEILSWNYMLSVGLSGKQFILIANFSVYDINLPNAGIVLELREDPHLSLTSQIIDRDTIIKCASDFQDGVIFLGSDKRFDMWQTWTVGSGSIGGFFDVYMPFSYIQQIGSSIGVNKPVEGFEYWYGDSRALWVVQFSLNDAAIFSVGNSSAKHVVSERIAISHSRGTNSFQFTISGYLERATGNIAEIGMIPLYMKPYAVLGGIPTMLSVTTINHFLSSSGGVLIRPINNYQATGAKIIDFQVSCEGDYCPITIAAFGYQIVGVYMTYIVWERYTNGTYTQKLMTDDIGLSKSALLLYSYSLETSITIQDSHLLDELHVFVDKLENNPYFVVFNTFNASLLVTDKITNKTLYDQATIFSDPCSLPIASKYEFYIRLFSTLDNLGFPFELVQVFVNNSQVSTDYIRILSPNANIVIRDFSNVIIINKTINRYVNGSYINLGLAIATIITSNQYPVAVDFFISRNGKSVHYQLPPETSIILRLALGTYHYLAMDLNGTTLQERDITFKSNELPSITLGKKIATVPVPTELNIIVAVISIGGITGAAIVVASMFRGRVKKPNKTPWG